MRLAKLLSVSLLAVGVAAWWLRAEPAPAPPTTGPAALAAPPRLRPGDPAAVRSRARSTSVAPPGPARFDARAARPADPQAQERYEGGSEADAPAEELLRAE